MPTRPLFLGRPRSSNPAQSAARFELPAHHLVTHGVVVGMTGSGKTGLLMLLVEECLRAKVPTLLVDVKGDLPNLLLTFPGLTAQEFAPWVDAESAQREGKQPAAVAEELASKWRNGLAQWGLGPDDVRALREGISPRIITPGSTAGEPLHVLSALEHPSDLWESDEEGAREALSASIALLLRLVGREGDTTRSREHVALSLFAEQRLRSGRPAGLIALLEDLAKPPVKTVGALPIEQFFPAKDRAELAQELNTLLAAPSFATWQKGAMLDVGAWLRPGPDGKTPAVIVSVAHLDDEERALVLGLLLDSVLAWVRTLPGTSELRALVLFDEVYGFVPPHPANPPTKRPVMALLKQARAFGVGVVLATQNPMDLDYKALSNAGAWFVGRLQTDADRARVVEGLAGSDAGAGGLDPAALGATLKSLPPRAFFVRDVHMKPSTGEFDTRWTLSWLRGPMTRQELKRLAPKRDASAPAAHAPSAPAASVPVMSVPGMSAPTAAQAAGFAPAAAPVSAPSATPNAPPLPEGYRTWYGAPPPHPVSRWSYAPWLGVTVVAHVRDAALGITAQRTSTLVAPLGSDGRPDITRAVTLGANDLAGRPVEGARYQPLPETFAKATAARAAEKTLRDHAGRGMGITVAVHKELKLVQGEQESVESFALRCRMEALRVAEQERAAVAHKHGPKVQKLQEKLALSQRQLADAERAAAVNPGVLGTLAIRAIAGKTTARAAAKAGDKAMGALAKARTAVANAQLALREAEAKRDAEGSALLREAERAHEGIERKQLVPKKTDVEVTAVGIAWSAQ